MKNQGLNCLGLIRIDEAQGGARVTLHVQSQVSLRLSRLMDSHEVYILF
jgi:hypothetical protein